VERWEPFDLAALAGSAVLGRRAIAAAHGAEVTAQARPDGGLQIEVAFPARDATGDPTGADASAG
jgi:hypothetical protein